MIVSQNISRLFRGSRIWWTIELFLKRNSLGIAIHSQKKQNLSKLSVAIVSQKYQEFSMQVENCE